jgi:hypothetical protein
MAARVVGPKVARAPPPNRVGSWATALTGGRPVRRRGLPAASASRRLVGGALLALAVCLAAGCSTTAPAARTGFALASGPIDVLPLSVGGDTPVLWPVDLSRVVAEDGAALCGVVAYHGATLTIEGTPSADGILEVATPRGSLGRMRLYRGRPLPAGDLIARLNASLPDVLRALRDASLGGHTPRPPDFSLRLLLRWWPDDLGDTSPLTLTRWTMRGTLSRGYDLYAGAGQ